MRQHCPRYYYTGKATANDFTLKAMLQLSNYTGKATTGDYTEEDATAGQLDRRSFSR